MQRRFSFSGFWIWFVAVLAFPVWFAVAGQPSQLLKEALSTFGKLPDHMPGSENDTPVKIELGRKLYFETALSINNTQSCNTCHRIDGGRGGVDNKPVSPGAIKGKFGTRNAPTVLNAGFHIAQFWDGRAATLAEQAKGPILNPVEMAMPNEEAVIERVKKLDYVDLFKKAFPKETDPVTYDNLAEAIAAFERTLITRCRFDDYLAGDEQALTEQEKAGLKLFLDLGCADCHSGPLLGGNQFRKMGDIHPYKNTKDLGRYEVTKRKRDKYVFKVPSLRNIVLTAPYFHDGQVPTLAEAIDQMAWLQLDEKLSAEQIQQILQFLVSLTDKKRSTAPAPDKPKPNWKTSDVKKKCLRAPKES